MYTGIIQKGAERGKALGFPTANIKLEDENISGIYAARASIDDVEYIAAAFADSKRDILEVHLLDFPSREIYGKEMKVKLYEKFRDSEEFENVEALCAAIRDDVIKVREFFKKSI